MGQGARAVYACITHGLLSGPALERINASDLKELIITDSIPPRPDVKASPKIRVLSVALLLAEAVKRIHMGDSLSSLFI
jgi:ribose-phosphate pyrophosphokinase